MANKDYRKDFYDEGMLTPIDIAMQIVGPRIRRQTKREVLLTEAVKRIQRRILNIFKQRKDNDDMLTDIERDVVALEAKVKQYEEEGA